jgi:hypothetical protein
MGENTTNLVTLQASNLCGLTENAKASAERSTLA